jgi:hypothetical protein
VIVDNKSGAAGAIGAVEVKNAKPDGYTLLVATSSTHAINPTAFVNPPYDAVKDFTPISSVCVNPLVLYANPSLPPTMMGLVELMKKNPGKYPYGSAGFGSIIHLAVEYRRPSRTPLPATSPGRWRPSARRCRCTGRASSGSWPSAIPGARRLHRRSRP